MVHQHDMPPGHGRLQGLLHKIQLVRRAGCPGCRGGRGYPARGCPSPPPAARPDRAPPRGAWPKNPWRKGPRLGRGCPARRPGQGTPGRARSSSWRRAADGVGRVRAAGHRRSSTTSGCHLGLTCSNSAPGSACGVPHFPLDLEHPLTAASTHQMGVADVGKSQGSHGTCPPSFHCVTPHWKTAA